MQFNDYKREVQAKLELYGFVGCPFSESELHRLHQSTISTDLAVNVASDVTAGFSFNEALEANK